MAPVRIWPKYLLWQSVKQFDYHTEKTRGWNSYHRSVDLILSKQLKQGGIIINSQLISEVADKVGISIDLAFYDARIAAFQLAGLTVAPTTEHQLILQSKSLFNCWPDQIGRRFERIMPALDETVREVASLKITRLPGGMDSGIG